MREAAESKDLLHFAILPCSEDRLGSRRFELSETYGIRPVLYPDGHHEVLGILLDRLRPYADAAMDTSDVTPMRRAQDYERETQELIDNLKAKTDSRDCAYFLRGEWVEEFESRWREGRDHRRGSYLLLYYAEVAKAGNLGAGYKARELLRDLERSTVGNESTQQVVEYARESLYG